MTLGFRNQRIMVSRPLAYIIIVIKISYAHYLSVHGIILPSCSMFVSILAGCHYYNIKL